MPTALINDIDIYYELRGRGRPLVLIVGFGTDITEWDRLISALSRERQVLAFDNRGAGRSGMPDQPYSIEAMADDTAGLMGAAGLGAADILGISMGGKIAMALALGHPEKVSKLILASTGCRSVTSWRFRAANALARLPVLRSRHPQPHYARRRQLEATRSFVCCGRLGEIGAPTLILHGRKDRFAPLEIARETHAGITGSKLVVTSGGHLFPLFRTKEFLVEVDKFLESE